MAHGYQLRERVGLAPPSHHGRTSAFVHGCVDWRSSPPRGCDFVWVHGGLGAPLAGEMVSVQPWSDGGAEDP